ncbi:acyl-CoA dehydrogenase/oxidase [Mycena amicta]|nr:acyl-CoA dehydrogenase/oxidase [Mycena amicta]
MTAFEHIFRLQCFLELFEKYGQLILNKGIHGCYLQTELGHGTNVGRLETTATYLSDTPEFEIHSPTLSSTKWWTGALGKTDTHGVVQAMLILPGGKDMGPHLLLVQLRDLDTHKVLPGLIGDIGLRVMGGFAAVDNGFARFDHVRIPKENMPSKFAGVTDSGEYVTPPHAKLSYGGMLYIRSGMVTTAGWSIGRAATITVRYATVRDGLERQVINYPSLNVRLVVRAYVFIQLGRFLWVLRRWEDIRGLPSSCDVRILSLWRSHDLIDILSRYEGENYVLDGQVLRAALKSFRGICSISSPPTFSPTSAYLRLLLDKNLIPPRTLTCIMARPRHPDTSPRGLLVHEAAQTVPIGQPDDYEALWKRVQDDPLNQTEVTEAYEPILLRGRRLAAAANKSKL